MTQQNPDNTARRAPDVSTGPSQPATIPPAPPLAAVPVVSTESRAARIRLCILCGAPLRAGQHLLRVHGTTVHARCTTSAGAESVQPLRTR